MRNRGIRCAPDPRSCQRSTTSAAGAIARRQGSSDGAGGMRGLHSLRRVTNAGYDREEWDTVLHMMINVGAPVPPDKFDTVLNYLAAKFPPKPHPEAKIISGPINVTVNEWVVPTPGSRPHDPMYAPDGSVWYTGQMANVLGR